MVGQFSRTRAGVLSAAFIPVAGMAGGDEPGKLLRARDGAVLAAGAGMGPSGMEPVGAE